MSLTSRSSRSTRLLPPALATRVTDVPAGKEWLHESKLDGYRIQAHVRNGRVVLLTRNGLDWSTRFPVLQRELTVFGQASDMILDGEVVMQAAGGDSRFGALQRAITAQATDRVMYWVFDLLRYDGMDLRRLPLDERRRALRRILDEARGVPHVKLSREKRGAPATLLATACRNGEEGIISKRRSAAYRAGRSMDWLKIKCGQQDEFVVVGYTAPRGAREHLGALLVATRDAGSRALRYAGRVGSGMDTAMLRTLVARLEVRDARPASLVFGAPIPRAVQWVEPTLVITASFAEWTSDGLLRQATFGGIREDKAMKSVRRERASATSSVGTSDVARSEVAISHADRVVYADSGITKQDIAHYIEAVAPLMLPHIAGRPLSLLRCPGGAGSTCFFQKHWTAAQGHAVTTRDVTEADGTTDPYAVAINTRDLLALVQSNALEIHVWGSKFPSIEKPDRIILDLDPGPGVTWDAVRDAARAVRDLLHEAGLTSWVKLSGGKGLHVTVPLSGPMSWEQASLFSKLVATRMAAAEPRRFTSTMAKRARDKRIFIDWMRNTRGATAIAPWSLRARPGAPIAMPLLWSELDDIPRGDLMSIGDVMAYLQSSPADPWADLRKATQRITVAMVRALGGEP